MYYADEGAGTLIALETSEEIAAASIRGKTVAVRMYRGMNEVSLCNCCPYRRTSSRMADDFVENRCIEAR